jgi:pyridoxine 4-dehydrogenase
MTDLDHAPFPLGGRPVHRIGFGAMQLPGRGVWGPPRDRDEALAVLRRAVELGVDHIDTAQYYGPDVANELIREALHPYPDDLVLVSKLGARRDEQGGWLPADTPDALRAGAEDNLRALGLDRIHAVNLRLMGHEPGDTGGAPFDEQLDAMIALRDEGLIGHIGLSNVSLEQLEQALARTEIACVQNAYNVLDRTAEPLLAACGERGIAFVPFFPMGSAFGGRNKVLEHPAVRAAAERAGGTPGQAALAWVLGRGEHVLLIPGTSSRAHLEENLAAGDIALDAESRAALDAAASV